MDFAHALAHRHLVGIAAAAVGGGQDVQPFRGGTTALAGLGQHRQGQGSGGDQAQKPAASDHRVASACSRASSASTSWLWPEGRTASQLARSTPSGSISKVWRAEKGASQEP